MLNYPPSGHASYYATFVQTSESSGTATINNQYGELVLQSEGNSGVLVKTSTPTSFWTFVAGDLITQADGVAIKTPEDLFAVIRSSTENTISCSVIRNGVLTVLSLSVANYLTSIPPAPPPPPPPPGM